MHPHKNCCEQQMKAWCAVAYTQHPLQSKLLLLLLLQGIQALTAASTADLLAVGLNLMTAAHADTASCRTTGIHIERLLADIPSASS
jgi:hypothetical protein